jgi:hypothetical protein
VLGSLIGTPFMWLVPDRETEPLSPQIAKEAAMRTHEIMQRTFKDTNEAVAGTRALLRRVDDLVRNERG